MTGRQQQGYVLFSVVVMLFVIAVTAYLVGFDSSFKASQPESELEALRAEYVIEAAFQHALWTNANNACAGSFSIPSTAFGPDSYAVTATGGGLTSTATLDTDQDGWIRSDNVTKNHAGDKKGHVRLEAGIEERAIYRYDLSSIAPGAQVNSAIAWFYLNNGPELPMSPVDVHTITTDWTEANANWELLGDRASLHPVATIPTQSGRGRWIPVNLTAQVQAWVNGQPNFGFVLLSNTEGFHETFSTKEDGARKPRLDVTIGTTPVTPINITVDSLMSNGATRTAVRQNVNGYQPVSSYAAPTGDVLDDTYVSSSGGSSNFGNDPKLRVGDAGVTRYALLDFELVPLPPGARIVSAELTLNLESVGAAPAGAVLTARRMLRSWTENGATWNSADGSASWNWPQNFDSGGPVASLPFAAPQAGPVTIDIAPLVAEWVTNGRPHFGLALAGENGVDDATFTSADGINPTLHPALTVTYACDCGTVCLTAVGRGDLLFVVNKSSALTPGEVSLKALFESWGYRVNMVDANWNQDIFDAQQALNDAVYVSQTAADNKVKDKLTGFSIGVITDQGAMNDELGIASGSGYTIGPDLEIVDANHFITRPFPPGTVEIYPGGMEGLTVSGSEAPGLQTLGEFGGSGGLVVLDKGAIMEGGGLAVGRRVMLPVGRESKFDWQRMNSNGRLLMRRSIEWAMGDDIVIGSTPLLFVVDDSAAPTVQDYVKQALLESWGYVVTLISAAESQATFYQALQEVDVVFISEEVASNNVGSKLRYTTVGVVSEEAGLKTQHGFSENFSLSSGSQLTIDNSHYITSPLPAGPLTLLSTSVPLAYLHGNLAPDLLVLGDRADGPGLVALDVGTESIHGSSPGRRVMFPWSDVSMDISYLNSDALTIFQRSLEWAADESGARTSPFFLSTDSNATLGGLDFKDKDVVRYTLWTNTAELLLDGSDTSLGKEIDGLHILADGKLLVSTKGATTLGGLSIEDSDIVEYDMATDSATMVFDGSELFSDADEKVTSVALLDNGNLLLSTDGDATLGGLDFESNDLVEYDISDDIASLYFDGDAYSFDQKFAAVHVLANGELVLAPKGDASLGGVGIGAIDLVLFDPVENTAEIIFAGASLFDDSGEKIISLHVGVGTGKMGCNGIFRDEFNAVSYSGNDGTLEWSGDWLEIGESNGASNGDIQVANDASNFQLQTKDNNRGIEREADLTGAANATLSYDYRRDGLGNANDYTAVQVSQNGAAGPWVELTRHEGGDNDTVYQAATHDISDYASGNTRIRFVTSANLGNNDRVWFDNIEISCSL